MIEPGAQVACPYCGEPFWVAVDAGGGSRQRFVSDCEICCRPIDFRATIDAAGAVTLHAATENDA